MSENNQGIVFIALGWKYFKWATECIQSLQERSSDYKYLIITDLDIQPNLIIAELECFSVLKVTPISSDLGISTAYLKTQLYQLSPFDKTLYLDCDIRAVRCIDCIWSFSIDTIAVSREFYPLLNGVNYTDPEEIETVECLAAFGDLTQYNTGVFLFPKNKETELLFKDWEDEWNQFQYMEHRPFMRLVAKGFQPDYLLSIYNDLYSNKCFDSVLIHYAGWYKKYL
jgi:hypothetical protein